MTTKENTVFVSGATGFIALHVVDDLLKAGYKVIGSGRSQEKNDGLLKKFNNHPQPFNGNCEGHRCSRCFR